MKPIVWLDIEQGVHKGDPDHPESPLRIAAIQTALQSLVSIHVKERSDPIPRILEPAASHCWTLDDGDTYSTPYTSALLDRGSLMIQEATRALALHTTNCAFFCIRPPGHHANAKGIASGFCHQNNVWIAIQSLKNQGFHSIGVFDWDAHHGDGTEDCVIAAADPNIRFASMHAFGHGIFPGTGLFQSDTILNIPLRQGTDSETYIGHFASSVLPFLTKGNPDIIIISAGYDGHEKDPMGLLQLREQTYTYMSGQLKSLSCPVLFLLEGGYNPVVLASCVVATLKPWLSA